MFDEALGLGKPDLTIWMHYKQDPKIWVSGQNKHLLDFWMFTGARPLTSSKSPNEAIEFKQWPYFYIPTALSMS